MNTETLRKMSRAELEDEMATLSLLVAPYDTDDELRDIIVIELGTKRYSREEIADERDAGDWEKHSE